MVVKILEANASALGSLMYNEEKCARCEADIIGVNGIDNNSQFAIYWRISQLEGNDAISLGVKKKGFHMTISPGLKDAFAEKNVMPFVNDIMSFLGYGNQPYAVYVHHDIERVHYHVVSVRVREDGTIIPNNFEGVRLNKYIKTLEAKYGFKVGRDRGDGIKNVDLKNVAHQYQAKGNKSEQIEAIFNDLFKYPLRDMTQVQHVLSAYNLEIKRRKMTRAQLQKYGGTVPAGWTDHTINVREMRRDAPQNRWVSLEAQVGIPADATLQGKFISGKKLPTVTTSVETMIRDLAVIEFALEASKGKGQDYFYSLIRPTGIELVIDGDKDVFGQYRFAVVDKVKKTYFTRSDAALLEDVVDVGAEVDSRAWDWRDVRQDKQLRFSAAQLGKINKRITTLNNIYTQHVCQRRDATLKLR